MHEHEVTIADRTLPVNAAIQRARRRFPAVKIDGLMTLAEPERQVFTVHSDSEQDMREFLRLLSREFGILYVDGILVKSF